MAVSAEVSMVCNPGHCSPSTMMQSVPAPRCSSSWCYVSVNCEARVVSNTEKLKIQNNDFKATNNNKQRHNNHSQHSATTTSCSGSASFIAVLMNKMKKRRWCAIFLHECKCHIEAMSGLIIYLGLKLVTFMFVRLNSINNQPTKNQEPSINPNNYNTNMQGKQGNCAQESSVI